MRIVLAKIAGVVGLAVMVFACSPEKQLGTGLNPITSTTLSLKCTATEITLTVNPPTLYFHHSGPNGNPTDLNWVVDPASDAPEFTIENKTSARDWPLEEAPPYNVSKTFNKKGKKTLVPKIYHYSISASCPNGGPKVTLDPDIVVD